jgi:hypothetical protein
MTMVIGVILAILGVFCFVFWRQLGAPQQSVTALIPTFVGVPMLVLGWLGLALPEQRKHVMHAAVVLSLLGFLMSLGRFLAVELNPAKRIFRGGMQAVLLMAVLCGLHVVLGVRSFIAARKAREGSAATAGPGAGATPQ